MAHRSLEPGFYADRPANFDTKSVHFTGLKPGQRYWAKRNGPGQVLTCLSVNEEQGWVVPQETAYPFDMHECFQELATAP